MAITQALKSTAKKAVRGLKSAGKQVVQKVSELVGERNTPDPKGRKKSSKSRASRAKSGGSGKR